MNECSTPKISDSNRYCVIYAPPLGHQIIRLYDNEIIVSGTSSLPDGTHGSHLHELVREPGSDLVGNDDIFIMRNGVPVERYPGGKLCYSGLSERDARIAVGRLDSVRSILDE